MRKGHFNMCVKSVKFLFTTRNSKVFPLISDLGSNSIVAAKRTSKLYAHVEVYILNL